VAGFRREVMLHRIFNDQYQFSVRAQLAHLFRVLYVSPQLIPATPSSVSPNRMFLMGTRTCDTIRTVLIVCAQRDGASVLAATRTGSSVGAVTAEDWGTCQHLGPLVSLPHLKDEVSWGRGFVGKDVARNPNIDVFDGHPEESKHLEGFLGDNTSVFNFVRRTRTAGLVGASVQVITTIGDAVLPSNGTRLALYLFLALHLRISCCGLPQMRRSPAKSWNS
jgi:hypothetical protein